MKYIQYLSICFFLILIGITLSPAQKTVVHKDSSNVVLQSGGTMFDIPELAALASQDGDRILVGNVMDASMRAKGYEKIDIQAGDIIMMANGKRMEKLEDLQQLYNDAKIGETIKLGIKRGEDMMIASFDKADPATLPKHKMVIRQSGGEDMLAIGSVGLMLGTMGKDIVITDIMDNAKEALPGADIKEGDVVQKLNGEKIASFKDLSARFQKLAVGDNVEFVTVRAGKTHTIKFKKQEDKGGMKIIRKTIGK